MQLFIRLLIWTNRLPALPHGLVVYPPLLPSSTRPPVQCRCLPALPYTAVRRLPALPYTAVVYRRSPGRRGRRSSACRRAGWRAWRRGRGRRSADRGGWRWRAPGTGRPDKGPPPVARRPVASPPDGLPHAGPRMYTHRQHSSTSTWLV